MAILSLQNFATLANNFATVVQGSCKYLIDFSEGSILLSVAEASSAVGLWMQWLILQVLNLTRAATSNGPDLDTWVNDFTLIRLPATYANLVVTFARFTNTQQALIQPGAQVKTGDGTQPFIVIADTTQTAWNPTLGCYVIAAGVTSCNVTTQAVNPGTQGNVQAGTVTLLASAIPFIDTVTNGAAGYGGFNAESDTALRARFVNFISTLSRGTLAAIGYAISIVQQGLSWTIIENMNTQSTYQPGNFIVAVDDGSGSPPSSLLDAVSLSISAYRPIGATWTVQGPSDTTAIISLSITTNPTAATELLLASVQISIVTYINQLALGESLPYSRVAAIAYWVDPSIISVNSVLLNGGTSDLVPAAFGAIRTTLFDVTVT